MCGGGSLHKTMNKISLCIETIVLCIILPQVNKDTTGPYLTLNIIEGAVTFISESDMLLHLW